MPTAIYVRYRKYSTNLDVGTVAAVDKDSQQGDVSLPREVDFDPER